MQKPFLRLSSGNDRPLLFAGTVDLTDQGVFGGLVRKRRQERVFPEKSLNARKMASDTERKFNSMIGRSPDRVRTPKHTAHLAYPYPYAPCGQEHSEPVPNSGSP